MDVSNIILFPWHHLCREAKFILADNVGANAAGLNRFFVADEFS